MLRCILRSKDANHLGHRYTMTGLSNITGTAPARYLHAFNRNLLTDGDEAALLLVSSSLKHHNANQHINTTDLAVGLGIIVFVYCPDNDCC